MSFKQVRSFKTRLLFTSLLAAAIACSDDPVPQRADASSFSGTIISDWIDLQLVLGKNAPGYTPPVVSRAFGYAGLTLYESVVHGYPANQSLVGQLSGLNFLPDPDPEKEYHWELCANAAAAQITRKMFENAPAPMLPLIDSLEAVYVQHNSHVPHDVIVRSILYGQAIADSIYLYSKTDGGHKAFNRNFPASYVPPAGPGLWYPTNSQLAMLPSWGNNRTFIKDLRNKVSVTGPPTFSTDPASDFYAEGLEVYNTGVSLTAEQTTIAYYWADEGFYTFSPPGHSLCIYSQLSREEDLNLVKAAEGFAKIGMAVSDAFVYCWYLKYLHNVLRPSQYIQPNIDPLWTPLIVNPPFPDYTSGHSSQSGAACSVLENIFGESYAFTDKTHLRLNLGMQPRSFNSFLEMAQEAAESRLYGGIHYRSANDHGLMSGVVIGDEVTALSFKK